MIDSLFGDLAPRRLPEPGPARGPAGLPRHNGLDSATAVLADTSAAVVDVVVDTSPAEAMRSHFAALRERHGEATRPMITLLDPSRLWAPQVLHALSDAAARPLERLNLRERATLRTLALIERITVPRLGAQPLKVVHPDIRVPGAAAEEIAHALAEGSALTAVIVGTLQPHALLAHLRALLAATRAPGWCCPWLVFVLPPSAAALGQRIEAQAWPAHVRVLAVTEAEGNPAGVWNSVLGAWEATRAYTPEPGNAPAATGAQAPCHALDDAAAHPAADAWHGGAGTAPRRPALSPAALAALLAPLARTDGMRACAIVDLRDGDLLATEQAEGHESAAATLPDLAAVTQGLCAARRGHAALAGDMPPSDEVLITAGPWQSLLRSLPGQQGLGFVAVLDRAHANLALLRFRLLDAASRLG
ncbi:hypothetical protein [Aquabacterium sp. OR-4]|uniref:hypothetical protein n=1 Tax=Aquabacterium sp. OR-4 TaxID=2978127 RepID=UPI0028C8A344|nr:hypothetical protein [Aquabacterium sp. OR-4]MDT7835515.1 hypothetical protein [Aquabacterium sp. OR-4]